MEGSIRQLQDVRVRILKSKERWAAITVRTEEFSVTIPQATGEVVYYAGRQVRPFDPPVIGTGGPVTISLPLGVGDPPVGLAH
jgi:hypothetical protein